jgi:hypothetical protein
MDLNCIEINKIDRNVKVCFFTAYEALYDTLLKQFPNLKSECLITKPISILEVVKKIDKELL